MTCRDVGPSVKAASDLDVALVYNTIDTIAGIASTAQNIMTGNVGWGDLLTFAPIVTQALSPKNCFTAGTEVLTGSVDESGNRTFSEKRIEDVAIGDYVWAKAEDDPDGELALKKVTKLFRHVEFDLQFVSLEDEQTGNIERLNVTDEHPFYVDGDGWTNADQLAVGKRVLTEDGRVLTIIANEDDQRPDGVAVFNFEVEGAHTYFVADGIGADQYVWVHNACAAALRADMNAHGITSLTDEAAHHIVARYSKNADNVRSLSLLDTFGIKDLDQYFNGVFLPKNSKVANPLAKAVHSKIHTNKYCREVYTRLSGAVIGKTGAAATSALRAKLQQIAQELTLGRFPY